MDIPTGITAALSTLKSGFEIKKLAGNLDSEVQQGELRVEIRKLQESLINVQDVLLKAKQEILDNRRIISEKDTEIENLKNLINTKSISTIDELPEQCIEILKSFNKTSEEAEIWMIAEFLHISEQKIQYL